MSPRRLLLLAGAALLLPAPASAQFSMPTTEAHQGFFYPTAYKDQGGRDWACGSIYYSGHGGFDIGVGGFPGMDAGRDLVAAADGTVIVALDGFFDRCTTANCPGGGGFGNYVAIDHGGGIVTYYGHMRQFSVAVNVGDQVTCGTYIGQVGSSGRSTGPHLHFDYRINGVRSETFSGSCSGVSTAWNDQGVHGGLPAVTCTAGGIQPFIVDDQDPEFGFTMGTAADANQSSSGGHDGEYYHSPPFDGSNTALMARWTPDVPATALYTVEVHIPPGAGSPAAPFDVAFQGGHAPAMVDLTQGPGWVEIHPNQPFKFVQGVRNHVAANNIQSGAPSETVAWDAIRWTWAGNTNGGTVGQGCNWSGDCDGELVCLNGACEQPCYAAGQGCPGDTSCEAATGVCGYGEWGEDDFEPGPWWNPSPADDTDQDGIPDWLEGQDDPDGDGLPNWLDLDSDGDGILDEDEGDGDYDHDGIPNYLDEDSDNDGVPDSDEAPDGEPVDSDGDGDPDFMDSDSDNDGVGDSDEYGDDPDSDNDGDGIPDALDPDSDNDGILDGEEWGDDPAGPVDSDGDGVPDWLDEDSDNDGLPDSFEGNDDSDGDGVPDYLDEDSDNDGIPDSEDPDSDGDGIDDGYGIFSGDDDGGIPGVVQDCGGCGGGGVPSELALPLVLLPVGALRRRRSNEVGNPGCIE